MEEVKDTPDPQRLDREMGCTEADFLRWLPGATRHAPVEAALVNGQTRYRVTVDGGTVEILLQPAPSRRIAALSLPVLKVSFRFLGLDAHQRASFLDYFDHYTRRGGG